MIQIPTETLSETLRETKTPHQAEARVASDSYARLTEWFKGYRAVSVAFSGGVDSTLVLKGAVDSLGSENVIAITADSASLPREELRQATELAREIGVKHHILRTEELSDPSYRANRGNRCYFCKASFYSAVEDFMKVQNDLENGKFNSLVDGTNLDDLADIRPGRAAAVRAGVLHPLVESSLDKSMVRIISKSLDLPTWDKPEMACLSSRIQTGVEVSSEKLAKIEAAEAAIKALGFREVRVRYHELQVTPQSEIPGESGLTDLPTSNKPLTLARIELSPSEIGLATSCGNREKLAACVKDAGFSFVTLDLQGYRKGGFAENIRNKTK